MKKTILIKKSNLTLKTLKILHKKTFFKFKILLNVGFV